MHRRSQLRVVSRWIIGILCVASLAPLSARADGDETRQLVAQAEAMLWFGIAENGRVREFAEALELLERADEFLAKAEVPDAVLARQIAALREDLVLNLERSRRVFYGSYPLARLVVPPWGLAQQDDVTETARSDSGAEAVRRAAERVLVDILRLQYPHVVFRSDPNNRAFENAAMRQFSRANRPFAHSRSELVGALTPKELAAFDRGDIDPDLVNRLLGAFRATDLLVLTVRESVDLPDGTLVTLEGEFYETGSQRPTGSFAHMGFSRARRDQIPQIAWAHLTLLAGALALAASTPSSAGAPWSLTQGLAMGTVFFVLGRLFATLAVMLMRGIIPPPDAGLRRSWWWPALLGLVVILGAGFFAWIAQARVSRIVLGSRTSRAVGMIFSVAALGACTYFIEPLLLLEPDEGLSVFVPFVLASAALALLTGYASRTGPPVPPFFVLGPVAVVPVTGMALLAMRPGLLWGTVAASALLCAAAVARHEYAVAHGLEEAEPDEDDAERADLERLDRLAKDLEKKLPI